MGLEKDLSAGEQLVTLFRPFLENLAASNLSPKTIQKHVDNVWALGGEFIRELHSDPPLRRRPRARDLPPPQLSKLRIWHRAARGAKLLA